MKLTQFKQFEILNPQTLLGGMSLIEGDVELNSDISQGGTVKSDIEQGGVFNMAVGKG